MFQRFCIQNVPSELKKKLVEQSEREGISISKIVRKHSDEIIERYSEYQEEKHFSRIDIDNFSESKKRKLQEISKKLGVNLAALFKIQMINHHLEQEDRKT